MCPPLAKAAIGDIVRTRKADPPSEIARLTEKLAEFAGPSRGPAQEIDSFMTWEQVREMAAAGTAFGAHGANHLLLTTMKADDAEADIIKSRNLIDARLEGGTIAFSYPNGSWNKSVADMVRRAGFQVAFTTPQYQSGGRFAAPRVNIHQNASSTTPMFLARIAGLF